MESVSEVQYLRDMAEVNERITKLNDKVFQLEMLSQQQATKAQKQEEVMNGVAEAIRTGTTEQKAAHEKVEEHMAAQVQKMEQADADMRSHLDTMIAHNAKSTSDEIESIKAKFEEAAAGVPDLETEEPEVIDADLDEKGSPKKI